MKIEFSNTVPFVPEWNNNSKLPEKEQIKTELKVLQMGSLLGLIEAFQKAQSSEDGASKQSIRPVVEEFKHLIPEHVVKLTGLYDGSGKALTTEDIVNYPNFLNLTLELLMKLAEISSPLGEDEKN